MLEDSLDDDEYLIVYDLMIWSLEIIIILIRNSPPWSTSSSLSEIPTFM